MVAKVTGGEFQPPAGWSRDIESKLMKQTEADLWYLIYLQDRTKDSLIDSCLSKVITTSISQTELIETANKATLIYFGRLAERIDTVLWIKTSGYVRNEAIQKFDSGKAEHGLPSELVKKILDTFTVKFDDSPTDDNRKKIVQYFARRAGWSASMPSCLSWILGYQTPEQEANELVLNYTVTRTRAIDTLKKEKVVTKQLDKAVKIIQEQNNQINILLNHLNNG